MTIMLCSFSFIQPLLFPVHCSILNVWNKLNPPLNLRHIQVAKDHYYFNNHWCLHWLTDLSYRTDPNQEKMFILIVCMQGDQIQMSITQI